MISTDLDSSKSKSDSNGLASKEIKSLASSIAKLIVMNENSNKPPVPRFISLYGQDSVFLDSETYIPTFRNQLVKTLAKRSKEIIPVQEHDNAWEIDVKPFWEVVVINDNSIPSTEYRSYQCVMRAFLEGLAALGSRVDGIGTLSRKWLWRALDAESWTSELEVSAQEYLTKIAACRRWVLLVHANSVSVPALKALRWLGNSVRADAVLILSSTDIPWSDAIRIPTPGMSLGAFMRHARSSTASSRRIAAGRAGGLLTRMRDQLEKIFSRSHKWETPTLGGSGSHEGQSAPPDGFPKAQVGDKFARRWREVEAFAAYPSVSRLDTIKRMSEYARMRCLELVPDMSRVDRDMLATGEREIGGIESDISRVERDVLAARARFLSILGCRFPDVLADVRSTFDGAYRLYGVQCRFLQNRSPQTFAGVATLASTEQADFATFLRLTLISPGGNIDKTGQVGALVIPFPSASALRRHVDWLYNGGSSQFFGWERWLKSKLPDLIDSIASSSEGTKISKFPREIVGALRRDGEDPVAYVEAASWLLELVELNRPLAADRMRAGPESTTPEIAERWLKIAHILLCRAEPFCTGDLVPEVMLNLARCAALCKTYSKSARRNLGQTWMSCAKEPNVYLDSLDHYMDSLKGDESAAPWHSLIDLHRIYVRELTGDDLVKVRQDYASLAQRALEDQLDELYWRARYGESRVELDQTTRSQVENSSPVIGGNPRNCHRILRAQILQQVQAARIPTLYCISKRMAPKIFLSYSTSTDTIAEWIACAINGDDQGQTQNDGEMNHLRPEVWRDKECIRKDCDFNPTIQAAMGSCAAFIAIFSPRYWTSPWCQYELNFMFNRCGLSGYTIPFYWAVADDDFPECEGGNKTPMDRLNCQIERDIAEISDSSDKARKERFLKDMVSRLEMFGQQLFKDGCHFAVARKRDQVDLYEWKNEEIFSAKSNGLKKSIEERLSSLLK